jgi:hypothetical protein
MTRTQLEALAERLDAVEHAEREVSLGMDMDPLKTANHLYAETCKEAAAAIREFLEQKPVAWRAHLPFNQIGNWQNMDDEDQFHRDGLTSEGVRIEYAYSAPVPAVDLAKWKREAMRLADKYADTRTGTKEESSARAALQSHLDKIGGK